MTIKLRKLFLVLLAISVITACGFQLRGALELSNDLSPVYLQQNRSFDLAREIKALLLSNKVDVVAEANQSNVQLILISEAKKRRILSVDTNGRAREYLLSYKVRYSIQKTSLANKAVNSSEADVELLTLTRSLLFDSNAVLAVSNESEVLYKDMRRAAARSILLKLSAYSTVTKEKKAKEETAAQ